MAERKTVYSDPEAFEPDDIPLDESQQVVGLAIGEEFMRYIRIPTLADPENVLELPAPREVVVAVISDANGILHCEQYDPAIHGEKVDFATISIEEFENNLDFQEAQESLTRVRKDGSSMRTEHMDDVWRSRGGDPSFKLPKEIHSKSKLR